MPEQSKQVPRDLAVVSYGQRFGMLPPLFYIGHLSDADFITLIEAALRSGRPIAVDDIDGIADQNILL